MSNNLNKAAKPMLIFIPDISGFSKFVANTDITHSQHIIEELLEILIDSNQMELEVSEIEGDAILFYKITPSTSIESILSQIESMYLDFHAHLKKYELTRICQCGACSTANRLKLKFVVTHGEVGFNKIKDHTKLFGKEVIVAHRLLKNEIAQDEYALITKSVIEQNPKSNKIENWINTKIGIETYDVGTVNYEYKELDYLLDRIPSPTIESFGPNNPDTLVFENKSVMDVPIELLFNVVSDYSIRHLWTLGIKNSDQLNGKISKNGSTHRCLINGNSDDPFFIAHDFNVSKDYIVFSETEKSRGVTVVYALQKIDSHTTELTVQTYLEANFIRKLIFKLIFKNKIASDAEKSLEKLNEYCKTLIKTDVIPDSQIVISVP
jgi:hypothetical protein